MMKSYSAVIRRSRRAMLAGFVGVGLAAGLAACGDDDETASSGGDNAAQTEGVAAEAKALVEELTPGAYDLPTEATTPPKGLNVWVMPCASAASGCQDVVPGVQAAAKELGWKVTVFDGRGDPARWADGFDQARVAGADAMISSSVDCAPAKQALSRATKSGVVTINVNGFDCEDEKVFSHTLNPAEGVDDWSEMGKRSGRVQAAWAVWKTDGNVKAIQLTNNEQQLSLALGAGFKEEIAKCGTCELLSEVPFLLADFGPPLVEKTNGALLKEPDANFVVVPFDPAAGPAAQAINTAGSDAKVLGALGAPQSIELIRSGRGQAMSTGWDIGWLGWAAVDDIIRIKNDQEPVFSGWALGLVDADNLPEGKQYKGPVDYEGNYKKIWGVE